MPRSRSGANQRHEEERGAASADQPFARFWRCALQVNPWDYSKNYRGQGHDQDEDAYNQALLEKCRAQDIKVVGIADHGSVDELDKLRDALRTGGVVVFPGFEIASTEKVHMVCLFAEDTPTERLNRYLGELGLADAVEGTRPSKYACLELAKRIHDLSGFWYAAHATGANGLLRLNNRDGGALVHVWQDNRCVRVAQIPGPVSDLPKNFRDIVENLNPDYHREQPITVIHAKDVAQPGDLDDPNASTWVKMTRPSFAAFKVAFLDPGSRVWLTLSDEPHSSIEALRIHGGYLDGVDARFSEHLNAVIGGRGTGKSTLVECLRYALELTPKGKGALRLHQDVLKENLGKQAGSIELTVRSAAQHAKRFTISRRYGEPPIVRDSAGVVTHQTPRDLFPSIEVYGQNEIFELAQDPESRLRLLERFLPGARRDAARRAELQRKLADNGERLVKARLERDAMTERVGRLPKLSEQLKGFHELGIETKLAKLSLFAREGQIVERAEQEVARVVHGLDGLAESAPDLAFIGDKPLESLPNVTLLVAVRVTLEELARDVATHEGALRKASAEATAKLDTQIAAWREGRAAGQREIDTALAALPTLAGKSGREVGAAYKALVQEIEATKPLETRKTTLDRAMASLEAERANAIAELSDLRRDRANELQREVATLNKRLNGKLRVALRAEGDRGPLTQFLVGCRLEGVGEKRLAWVEEREATPLGVASAARTGTAKLAEQYGLTPVVAEALAKLPYAKLLELEAIELADQVEVELNVAHDDAAANYRNISHLSTGQKCTAILHLLLLVNPDPLIIDQPEDNLDNAFIAERIVRELRDAKTRRQFLFSTHNANIPVFGDAEWIGVLTADEDRGALGADHQGSIDVPYVREQAAEILEGGRAAFNQRKEMYEY